MGVANTYAQFVYDPQTIFHTAKNKFWDRKMLTLSMHKHKSTINDYSLGLRNYIFDYELKVYLGSIKTVNQCEKL